MTSSLVNQVPVFVAPVLDCMYCIPTSDDITKRTPTHTHEINHHLHCQPLLLPCLVTQETSIMSPPGVGVFTRPGESSLRMQEHEETRRRKRRWVIGLLVVVVVIILVVVLALTIWRAREPRVEVNSVELETFSVGASSLNMSLLLDLTVHNPNRAEFKYSESVATVLYYGDPVGQALVPAGDIKARADAFLSVLLLVQAARVLVNANLPGDIVSGRLPVLATTTLSGQVKVLGVFKHHAVTTSECDITIFVANATIQSFYCKHVVKL